MVQECIARFDCQLTAVRHGVARIHSEIENKLLQLRGIAEHERQVWVWMKLHVEILPDQARDHPLGFGQDVVEIQYTRLQDLKPAECQELSRKRPCTFGRGADVF